MKRNISELSKKVYDVAVIGGGICGASVARDAALRGLTVAVLDKGDFGGATSANSHKIIHGGLRYLQHGDLKRMRQSIRERRTLMRIAPHLMHPLPFLVPTYKGLWQGRLAMSAALKLNDLISLDRNRSLDPDKHIPRGRMISKDECLQLCPGLDESGLTGGALFCDAQVHNADRFTISVLSSAAEGGADLVNYAQVTGFLQMKNRIMGLQVKDVLSGDHLDVQARVVINCSGPWIDHVVDFTKTQQQRKEVKWLKGLVLVTRPLVEKIGVGISSKSEYTDQDAIVNKGYRYLCITPWRNSSLIGTFQVAYDGKADDFLVKEEDIESFIREVNIAFPGAGIKIDDVRFVYAGLLPRSVAGDGTGDAQLMKNYEIRDHEPQEGIEGLISVIPVKYTTARDAAESTVNLALRKLGRTHIECQTAMTPIPGGTCGSVERLTTYALQASPAGVSGDIIRHLVRTYGSGYKRILRYCEENPVWGERVTHGSPVIKAEVLHGIREEMAEKLSDIILRRTELGTAGHPGDACLSTCAGIMAAELDWNGRRIQKELEETNAAYFSAGCEPWTATGVASAS